MPMMEMIVWSQSVHRRNRNETENKPLVNNKNKCINDETLDKFNNTQHTVENILKSMSITTESILPCSSDAS